MIAISYRREDTAPITGRIYDRLQSIFGRDRVFLDFDSIPFGVDFRTHISESLNRCDTLLVVIGPHWSGASPDGSRRIDDPTDFVRFEVAQALAQNIRVIPLLIDRTDMPSSSSLPEDLKSLPFRNALRVDSGADFHHHIDRLCSSLQSTLSSSTPTVSGSPQPKMPEEAVKQVHQGLAGASGYDGIPSKGNFPKKRVFGLITVIIGVVAVIVALGTFVLNQRKLEEQKRLGWQNERQPLGPSQKEPRQTQPQPGATRLAHVGFGPVWAGYGEKTRASGNWHHGPPDFKVQGGGETSVPKPNDLVTALHSSFAYDSPPVWNKKTHSLEVGPPTGQFTPGDKAQVLEIRDIDPPTEEYARYWIRLSLLPKE